MVKEDRIQRAATILRESRDVVVLTGAGISAESGVPTFRGADGLWKNYSAQELATPEAFQRDPQLVWEWYDWRRSRIARARPNPGHLALTQLEKATHRFTLVTQNVDGLHDLAGNREILEVHGNIWKLRCTECGLERVDRTVPLDPLPPLCECRAMMRPGVVWFGESLPEDTIALAFQRANQCDAVLVAGTSAVVYPAAGVALAAIQAGIPVIEVNLEETELSAIVEISIRGRAGEVLPFLINDREL